MSIRAIYEAAVDKPILPTVFSGRLSVPCTDPDNLVYPYRGVLAGKYRNPDNKRRP